jgi:thiamine-phosphate pyrophosphorylase
MLGRLHVITDNRFGRDPRAAVPIALEGGADVIQVRVKGWTDRDLLELAEQVVAWCRPYGAACIVNDRVDVALAAKADGVHLGPEDMTAEDARRLLGPKALIGISIKSTDAAEAAPIELIDYVGSGGVYVTLSKQQKNAPIGTEGLGRIAAVLRRRAPQLPLAGIAGIDAGNAAPVIAAGANGVAVISAISLAPDPAAAARTLRAIVDAALAKRGG